jgi:hypothetical protein
MFHLKNFLKNVYEKKLNAYKWNWVEQWLETWSVHEITNTFPNKVGVCGN